MIGRNVITKQLSEQLCDDCRPHIKNFAKKNKERMLHRALRNEHVKCAEVLLKAGVDVNWENNSLCTPLHTAIISENTKCVELLLEAGVDVNTAGTCFSDDGWVYTPLSLAIGNWYDEAVKLLIQAGAEVNVKHDIPPLIPPLMVAASSDDLITEVEAGRRMKCIELLLEAGADVNFEYEGDTALNLASRCGLYEVVDRLIRAGADVNYVTEHGVTSLIELLQFHDNSNDDAFTHKDKKCVELLLQAGADVNIECRGDTALNIASRLGLCEAVDLLIRAGADVNKGGGGCVMPLIEASRCSASVNRRVKCLDLLIKAGADVNKTFVRGDNDANEGVRSVLRTRTDRYNRLLKLQRRLITEFPDTKLFSPLLASASRGCFRTTELLLRAGADVNLADSDGYTALMRVCFDSGYLQSAEDGVNYFGCTKILLCFGAKINIMFITSSRSLNALQLIQSTPSLRARDDICRLLYAAGESGMSQTAEDALAPSDEKLDLKHLCRVKIRNYLLSVDQHTNLFVRVPTLGLPSLLNDYLLYNISPDDDIDKTNSRNSDIDDDNNSGHSDADSSSIED